MVHRRSLQLALLGVVLFALRAPAQGGFTVPVENPMSGGSARATVPSRTPEGCTLGLSDELILEVVGDDVCLSASPVVACVTGEPCIAVSLEGSIAADGGPERRLSLLVEGSPQPAGNCNRNRQLLRPTFRGCAKNEGWLTPSTGSVMFRPRHGTPVQFTFREAAPPQPARVTSPAPPARGAPAVWRRPPREDRRRGFHPGVGLAVLAGFNGGVLLGGALEGHAEYSFGLIGLRASPRLFLESALSRWIAIGGALEGAVHLNLGRVFTLRAGAAVGVLPTSPRQLFYFAPTGGLSWKFGPASAVQLGLGIEYPLTGQPFVLTLSFALLFDLARSGS